MSEYVTVSVRLPKELHLRLKRRAEKTGKSQSEILRELLYFADAHVSENAESVSFDEGDPLWLIGVDAVDADVTDASVKHDDYLNGPLSATALNESRNNQ